MAQSAQRPVGSQSLPSGYELENSESKEQKNSGLPEGYAIEGAQPAPTKQSKSGGMTPPPSAPAATTSSVSAAARPEDDGFWHWFFGSMTGDPKYKDQGLIHQGFLKMSEIGKAEAKKRQDYRSSKAYYDSVIGHYNDQIASVNARTDIDESTKAWHRKLIEEEKNNRLGGGPDAAIEQFAPNAIQTASKIGEQTITPKNIGVATLAAVAPPLRPFIGGYYAVTGLMDAFKPRNDDPEDPEFESDADYTERVLLSASQVSGSLALMKAPHRTAEAERRYRLNKATFAAGGGNQQFDTALGDIDQTLHETKAKVKSVSDVQDLVKTTERRLNQHFEQALFPLRGQRMLPNQVADALEAKANQPNLQMTPEGRMEAGMYRRAAANYRQEWTLEKLDLERRRLFDSRMAKKTSVQQSASRRQNISTDIDQTIEDNIRDLEYSELNRRYPNQKFDNLKLRQAKLVELKDMLEKRVDKLRNDQAKEKGAPILMSERATGSATKHGVFGRVSARIPGAGPETAANRAAGKAFKTPGPGRTLPPLQTPRPQMPPGQVIPPTPPAGPGGGGPRTPPTINVPPSRGPAAGGAGGAPQLMSPQLMSPQLMSPQLSGGMTPPPQGAVEPEIGPEMEPEIEAMRRGASGEPPPGEIDQPTRQSVAENLRRAQQRTPLKRDPAVRAKVEAAERAADAPKVNLGSGASGLGGRTTRSISINGKAVGSLIYSIDGDTLTIDHFGGPQTDYNALKNALGREGMAQLRDQLLKAHPEVKHVQGIRVGGARGEESRSVRVPVSKLRRGKMTPPPAAEEAFEF